MNRLLNRMLLALLLLPSVGCELSSSKYVDVSKTELWGGLVNVTFVSSEDLLVHEIDMNSDGAVDWAVVCASPGISGREVVLSRTLPAGTEFTVTRAEDCENCLGGGVRLQIHTEFFDRSRSIPAYLIDVPQGGIFVREGGGMRLNPERFRTK